MNYPLVLVLLASFVGELQKSHKLSQTFDQSPAMASLFYFFSLGLPGSCSLFKNIVPFYLVSYMHVYFEYFHLSSVLIFYFIFFPSKNFNSIFLLQRYIQFSGLRSWTCYRTYFFIGLMLYWYKLFSLFSSLALN